MHLEELNQLAKVELHCHLDGSLSLEVVRQLAGLAKIDLPQSDQELQGCLQAPENVESLNDYLKVFSFVRPLLQTREALSLAAYDVARQAAQDGVIYLEVRFAPELSMDQGLSAAQVVQAVLAGLHAAREEFGILAKALVCGLKQSPEELNQAVFEEVVSLADSGLAGFDFAGNEVDFPTQQMEKAIKDCQALGLPMTFHAGECGCSANVAYAVQLGIKRIGHGTALGKSPEVINQVLAAGTTIEMCLTSNLQTRAVASLAEFPYPALYQAGAALTINTDNRTVSNTTLTREYSLFQEYFQTSKDDFYQFNRNAIEASFASVEEKEILRKQLEANYQSK
ncbi:adenosine deaminase [Streptococcus suis]|uniref:Adenosine deaminase n=1 Tax=Streptococcus suis TaxID=1307 RepID=A0A4T2GNZ4_STRSU|nr:adenosine deaminase [Streptococcus suis]MBM7268855.1 adenosine deaminase [Streptococcus suis]MBM7269431.1 adenosine deaminase [Streptococcus suis]TII00198.1 adenosine deaminase [Streptococcus suis]TII00906.1 adenosine deaminase [Streptococcus suis]